MLFPPSHFEFRKQEKIQFTRENTCPESGVVLHVWNSEGRKNECEVFIQKIDPKNRCKPLSCYSMHFRLQTHETLEIEASELVSRQNFREESNLNVSFELEEIEEPFLFSLSDSGVNAFQIVDSEFSDTCMGEIVIEANCIKDTCRNIISIASKTVRPNEEFDLKINGYIPDSIFMMNIPLKWDPEVLELKDIDTHFSRWREINTHEDIKEKGRTGISYLYSGYEMLRDSFEINLRFLPIGNIGDSSYISLLPNPFIDLSVITFSQDSSGIYYEPGLVKIDQPTSVFEITQDYDFKVYPNPTYNKILITSISKNHIGKMIRILDSDGKVLIKTKFSHHLQEVNVSHLSKGLKYLVVDSQVVESFVISH